ncbi:CNT_collapsed_G0035320.mRNA.1.CDS.1 [Saccharomyces cerevisiae]|nr:CNT_collapsed_G0035320.mRNA.1.CDS.1 [Saccharomyces cerevisiae]
MIEDQVPKAVMCLLVNYCKDSVQNRLVTKLYKETLFEELLVEDQTLAQDRELCVKSLGVYKKAATLISNIL